MSDSTYFWQQKCHRLNFKDNYKHQGSRNKLVDLLRSEGIKDKLVLKAIGNVPRHLFVRYTLEWRAYDNIALQIDEEQTISQPYTVAFQSQSLQIQPGDKVLEIGTGSGYQASVLYEMGAEVYTIERIRKLYQKSGEMFNMLNYKSIKRKFGDGYEGWTEQAPFDKIIVTAAPNEMPENLLRHLKDGGQMIVPVGDQNEVQKMYLITRQGSDFMQEELGHFRFVPMVTQVEKNSRFKYK